MNRLKYTGIIRPLALTVAAVTLAVAHVAHAKDPLVLQGASAGGPLGPQAVTIGSSSLPDMIQDLVQRSGAFAPYAGDPTINANLSYFGEPVLTFNINDPTATGGVGPVTASILGLPPELASEINANFSGATRDDVEDQMDEWVKQNGANALAALNKYLSSRVALPPYGGPDGTPAKIAQQSFDQYALPSTPTRSEREKQDEEAVLLTTGFGLVADAGFSRSRGYEAQSYTIPLTVPVFTPKSKRWALRLDVPVNWTQVEGADIFRLGLNLAAPILVVGKEHIRWQVTPSGGSQATGSYDLVTGGVLNHGSVSSSFAYTFREFHDITLTLGNQITFVESLELDLGDYKFDPGISQQITRNGLKIGVPFAQSWIVETYFVDTRFLSNSYMDGYETVGAAIGFKENKAWFKIGTYANFGKNYSSLNFQLGTGWSF